MPIHNPLEDQHIKKLLQKTAETHYRALLFLQTKNRTTITIQQIAHKIDGDCILIGDRNVRQGNCRIEKSPHKYREILGGEASAGIISLPSLIRPSIIAAVAETVRGGGFLAIIGGLPGEWTPGPREGLGAYESFFYDVISKNKLHAWWIDDRGIVSWRIDVDNPPVNNLRQQKENQKNKEPLKTILKQAKTPSQTKAIKKMHKFMRTGKKSFLLLGDRGRGKSYSIGLLLALLIGEKHIGRTAIVAPTPYNTQSLFKGLLYGLAKIGIKPRKIVTNREGLLLRVSGAWYKVSYESPETYDGAPLLVIDEAAALGVARTRILSRKSGKIIAATTVHGYEGSGYMYARLIEKILPAPRDTYILEEPIRYPPGDPLEEWLYEYMMLKPEPIQVEVKIHEAEEELEYKIFDYKSFINNWELLRNIASLLQLAHYRNTPDYLLLLLETPYHKIHALYKNETPIAVADVVEENTASEEARTSLKKLGLLLAPETLDETKIARVSRIAVHPLLQRRGLGTRLLQHLEDYYQRRGYVAIASLFSRLEVIGFWIKNNYMLFYVSPRYNKVTGEKNLGVVKPLMLRYKKLLMIASCRGLKRLLLASQSIYRDLPIEVLQQVLAPPSLKIQDTSWTCKLGFTPEENMRERLRMYCNGMIEAEQVWDALYFLFIERILSRGLDGLEDREARLVLAWLIQGRPFKEAMALTGLDEESARELLNRVLRGLFCGD